MATNKKISSTPSSLAPRPLRLRVETESEDVRIEVVPLIDVIFCILTFFILAAVSFSRQQAISVDLPKASTGTPQGKEILIVSLTELGQVYVEQQPVVAREEFLKKLQEYRQKNPDGLMALYASTNASYSEVVQVLDLLRQVGGDRVALATLPGDGQSPQTPTSNPPQAPSTGVPGYPPYPGANRIDPYGTPNPANPVAPTQPQLPGLPGTNPGIPQLSPVQPGLNPGNSAVPTPGVPVAPGNNNAAPGNSAVPTPGVPVAPRNNNAAPGNSAVPTPGVPVAPRNNNAAPGNLTAPTPGVPVAPRNNNSSP